MNISSMPKDGFNPWGDFFFTHRTGVNLARKEGKKRKDLAGGNKRERLGVKTTEPPPSPDPPKKREGIKGDGIG
jgi:hypothetical protein